MTTAGASGPEDANGRYRVGVDVGGTFTDLICITPDGEVIFDKTPTTPHDQSSGVVTGLGQLAGTVRIGPGRRSAAPSRPSSTAPPPPTTP